MSIYKRGKFWVADFYIGGRGGLRVRKGFESKEQASTFERNEKLNEFKGELGVTQIQEIRLKEFIDKYKALHSPTKTDSSRERDGYTFGHILKFFGNPLLKQISVEKIETYKATRHKTVQATTVNKELDLLKSLLNRSVEWGYLKTNPAPSVRRFKEDTKEPDFLTSEEGAMLMAASKGQMHTLVVIGLCAGLRKSEIFRLRWEDVDFDRGVLRVRISKGKSFRIIPMNDMLTETLRQHPRHMTSSIILHNTDGSAWKDVRWSFDKAVTGAGLTHKTFHSLRHSFVSNLVTAGVDLRVVQELAGHRDLRTTMRYAHLAPGRLANSVQMLNWSKNQKEIRPNY